MIFPPLPEGGLALPSGSGGASFLLPPPVPRAPVEAPPAPSLALVARFAATEGEALGLQEVRRVCRLPVTRRLLPEEVDAVSRAEIDPRYYEGTHPRQPRDRHGAPVPVRFWRQQAEAILSFAAEGGGHFSLRVSGGKSWIACVCVKKAHSSPSQGGRGVARSLWIVPSNAYGKLLTVDLPRAREYFGFDVPVHGFGGLSPRRRLELARSGLRGAYLTTYSLLQRESAGEELASLSPQLVVGDEAHALCDESTHAAMKRRVRAMVERARPSCVWLSGTMSKRSMSDSLHLLTFALRERAPVPLDRIAAAHWASVIDSPEGARVSTDLLASLDELRQWALEQVREGRVDPAEVGGPLSPDADGIRRAYRVRRNTAPGVVAVAERNLGTTLAIRNLPPWRQAAEGEGFPAFEAGAEAERLREGSEGAAFDRRVELLEASLEDRVPRPTPRDWVPGEEFASLPPFERMVALSWAVRARLRTPNGDEIEDARQTWRWQYELSAGFYHELVWPEAADLAAERGVSLEEARDLLRRARAHRRAEGEFVKGLRAFLEGAHVPGLDAPLLVRKACAQGDRRVPESLRADWLVWKESRFDGMPSRLRRRSRVCDWKVRAAVDWARGIEREHGKGVGGLVWCFNREVARWCLEAFLEAFGPDRVLDAPATPEGGVAIQDPASASRFTIASIMGHREAKDLFHYQHQVLVQSPRNAVVLEQLLGRTHRFGQQADELVVATLHALEFDHRNWAAMLHDAMWLSQAEEPAKVIHADYQPTPRFYTARMLEERGFALEAGGEHADAALRLVLGAPGSAGSTEEGVD